MLRGRTVALRPWEKRDVPLLTRWRNDPEFRDASAGLWPTRAQELEEQVAHKLDYRRRGDFLIVLADTLGTAQETAVGEIGFFVPNRSPALHCFEIGYSVHPDHRRQGHATQAARLLVNRLFSAHTVHRVQAHCRVDNMASQRVLENAGMTREGVLRGVWYTGGRYGDAFGYSILRTDWGSPKTYAERFGGL